MPGVQVKVGYKFAVLALAHPRATIELPSMFPIGDYFALSRTLPENAIETWEDTIGRLHRSELEEESLFVWALKPSDNPGVLDAENEVLQRDAYRLCLGLLIAVPFFSTGRITSLSGANAGHGARVRSLTTYAQTYHTVGVPTPTITATRARFAASMAEALVKHETQHQHGRFVRTLRTFREACETYHLDQRLHQFVRALEGFTAPPFRNSRVHFAERIKRICAGPASRHLLEMYTIRSGIEHLHGPYDRLRKFSDREKWQRLVVRCVEAEVVARYMISTYLSNQQLWPHFESRESIDAFWHLKPAAFRMLWRTRIHFPTIAKGIEHRTLEREYSKEFARG